MACEFPDCIDLPPIPLPSAPQDIIFTFALIALAFVGVLAVIKNRTKILTVLTPPMLREYWWLYILGLLALPITGLVGYQFINAAAGWGFEDNSEQHEAIRNIGLVLAALIGAPFVIWRAVVAQKQADVAEQSHITDRISKAVEQLGAEKVVKKRIYKSNLSQLMIGDKTGWENVENTEPNIEVRTGGIYSLERISKDSPDDHIQITEILCAYVRENSPVKSLDPANPLFNREVPRIDIQAVISVIARRDEALRKLEVTQGTHGKAAPIRLDLRNTYLQSVDMEYGHFENVMFNNSNMEKANLNHAKLNGAIFYGAVLKGAKLIGARLNYSELCWAILDETDFAYAHTNLLNVKSTDLSVSIDLNQDQVNSMFGDATTTLPAAMTPPHWHSEELEWGEFSHRWKAAKERAGFS